MVFTSSTSISGAVIHDATNLLCVVLRVFGCAPDTGNTELSAPAILGIERAIHPPPSVALSNLYPPAVQFGVRQGLFDIFVRVSLAGHSCHSLGK
jgi:hypothetical protein